MADGATLSQADRLLSITTKLGQDAFILTAVNGEMELSRPFSFSVTMLSEQMDVQPAQMLNSPVAIAISRNQINQPLHGLVRRFWSGSAGARGLRVYRAEIVPWFWFLTCTNDCRIFQNMAIPDIVTQLFKEYGFADYELKLTGTYPPLEYCVQYRESAFNFISRWLEKLGIFYFFRHEATRHVLVLADNAMAFKPVAENIAIYGGDSGTNVTRWEHTHEFRPGAFAHGDYDYDSPSLSLLTQKPSVLGLPGASKFEIYDYPGCYQSGADGETLTRTRLEEDEARYHTVAGDSTCHSYVAGGKFTMGRHAIAAEQTEDYALLRVIFEATDPSVANAADLAKYANSFIALPAATVYRPERRTRIPFVQGPQTAKVVGSAGEIITTDSAGRVKIQFHWDRRGTFDDHSSCWVRVSQNWGGSGWGGVFIPHVGHEVVVSFLEGDPDRPLITGRVYNGENKGSVSLPANATQSTIRDHTGNEIVLEGKAGSQDFRMTAVKDMNVTVQHDYNDKTLTGNRTILVAAGTHTETIKGNTAITVTAGALSITVAANTATYTSKGTTSIASAAADVHVQAKTQIALDVGASHLLMLSNGTVSLTAKNVIIQGSESVSIQGNAIRSIADQEHEIKGAITVSEGVTSNTVKGGMVMLNPGT